MIKTGDIVDAYVGPTFVGRGIVVALRNSSEDGIIAKVETFDGITYECSEDELDK